MNTPVVLFYNLDGEPGAKIRVLCMQQKVRIRTVKPEEYSEPVAALAGLEPMTGSPYSGEGFSDKMLVFCGFYGDKLDRFLKSFRRAGLPPVALKAVMTPTNAAWTSVQLHQELAAEHAAMTEKE